MKNFLKKYLSEEALKEVEQKYIADHPEAKELPVYISKARLDEVLGQKKTVEQSFETYKGETAKTIEELKQGQAKAIEEAVKAAQAESTKTIDALKKDFEVTEAIRNVKGKNVKAIKALIDPEKKLDDELARLQKDEAYLFETVAGSLPTGTGKEGSTSSAEKELAQMRAAVGIG